MGHKNVCFNCRKSFNMGTNLDNIHNSNCPQCGQAMKLMTHRFRPPKKDDEKKWLTAKYLVENGFPYQHIYVVVQNEENHRVERISVAYPDNMRDAKEFVKKYKDQAIIR